jgi:hypothetical protein
MPDEPHKTGEQVAKRRVNQKKYAKLPVQQPARAFNQSVRSNVNKMDFGIIICRYYKKEDRYVRKLLNATEDKCRECGVAITIAPSGRAKVEQEGLRPMCIICGVKIMKREGVLQTEPISPEQSDEIKKAIGDFLKHKGSA